MNPRKRPARSRILAAIGPTRMDGQQLILGWCYDGPGSAQFGWYLRSVAGQQTYLGRTSREVLLKFTASAADK